MTTLEVKTEEIRDLEIEESILTTQTVENHPESLDQPRLAGLMLSMKLRETLSEQDRSLLSKLAPPDRSVFLVHRGRFVHPTEFDIFPLEHIGGCAGEQAFFSHRFFPEGEPNGQASTIQTAMLNPGEPNSLLFGWYGPEVTSHDGSWDHRFSRLVADMRRAYSESAALAHRLHAQLKTEVPTLVIDRQAGRLLWLNESAAKLCGQDPSALVDLRFEQVRALLSRTLTHRRLTMKRFSSGCFEVTMVTIPEINTSTHPTNRAVDGFPEYPSHQKLASIIMAAELLRSSLSDHGDSEGVELSDIIAREARELDDLISTEVKNNPRKILDTQ